MSNTPVVYTIRGCDACMKLLKKWDAEGIVYDERRVELSQETLDEARRYGSLLRSSSGPTGASNRGSATRSGVSSDRRRLSPAAAFTEPKSTASQHSRRRRPQHQGSIDATGW